MTSHRFDPVSAVLGLLAVAGGLIVATNSTDRLSTDGSMWFALAALIFGLAMIASVLRGRDIGDDTPPPG